MPKELIINETYNECRIALLENDEILELHIDRSKGHNLKNYPLVGNIYQGKVVRVLPGMQSAFVDIGTDRAAFLYIDDAYIPTLEEQREIAEKVREYQEVLKSKPGEIIHDEMSTLSETVDLKFRPNVKIQDVLREGDSVLVQVAKEPISTKGPRVTRHITLAGRHIVFMPFIEHAGVSRRIEKEEERDRLKEILDSIKQEGKGMIARTVAEGQSYKTLKADYNILVKTWKDIQKKLQKAKVPSQVHTDLSFLQRCLRDITGDDVDSIIVDNKSTQKQVEKFIVKYLPEMKGKVKIYNEEKPIFDRYGVDLEIERGLSDKVFLKSGGSLNIDQTEALVSIDVNTGRFVGKKSLEDTILRTNLEAVKEIAYQLRLRNCGGLIIIDFIDMEKLEHRESVYKTLLAALKKDRSKTKVLPISELGLVEMTRKRTRDTLIRTMCEHCPYCEGTGKVKSVMTVSLEIIREIMKTVLKPGKNKIQVFAHPEVSLKLTGSEFAIPEYVEETFQKTLNVRADNSYHVEQYEIFSNEY